MRREAASIWGGTTAIRDEERAHADQPRARAKVGLSAAGGLVGDGMLW
jgi:hypothetical protein